MDSIMGSGKTTAAINQMKNLDDKNYIFITPYLAEIKRVKESCTGFRKFYDPLNKGDGKLENLHYLLTNEKDIATTHALFKTSNHTTIELLKAGNYTLVLDEVVDVVEKLKLSKDDLNIILDKLAYIDENRYLIWKKEYNDYHGKFSNIKHMAENKNIIVHNDVLLFWIFPVEVFKAFKEIYILTYLFDSQIQKYYYDLYDLEYNCYIPNDDNTKFIIKDKTHSEKEIKQHIKENINIIDGKINNIGNDYYALSSTWYGKQENKPLIRKMKKNLINYFKSKTKTQSDYNMWTSYKEDMGKLKGKGYTKGFVSCNARATNEFKHKQSLAYVINRFMNPIIKEFFISKNININEDLYALSELIQWIWRSQIRNNEPITIYIPSSRMRKLLINWLEN